MTSTTPRALPAQRLLDAACDLFLKEGIRAVGIDRLLAQAQVARASLYQTYGSKDALVVAYVERCDATDRAAYLKAAARCAHPRDRVLLVFDLAIVAARKNNFRGCLYLNALTEFPGPDHPIRAVVASHRAWLTDTWTEDLAAIGEADPAELASQLLVLYDGGEAGCKVAYTAEPIKQARQIAALLLPTA